jgi:membrane associated rhomboid family serine protease
MWQFGLFVLGTQFYHYLQVAPGDKTAYWIHFGGVVAGLALWFFWLRQRIEDFKRSPAGEHLLQA